MSLFPCVSNPSEFIHVSEQYFFELNGETLSDGSRVYMRYDVNMLYNQKNAYQNNHVACSHYL